MASKYGVTPPDLNECKTYEAYKRELSAWASVTELASKKQGNFVALSLPNKSKFGNDLRERVFENLSPEVLSEENGLQRVLEFLDQELGKDAIDDVIEKWDDFDSCKKKESQSLEDFISEFEMKSNRVKATGTNLSGEILAYMLMKRAGLTNLERMLVLSRVDIADKVNLYKNVKLHMSNILGKCMKTNKENNDAYKLEPAFLAQHEDVLAAAGYYPRNRAQTAPSKFQKGNSYNKNKWSKLGNFKKPEDKYKDKRPMNPKGQDGKVIVCRACGSFRHLLKDCQHSYEKLNGEAHVVQDEYDNNESCNVTEDYSVSEPEFEIERFVLFTSDKEELSRFTSEALNCAALDTCCTSTVAGEKWLGMYLKGLSKEMKSEVEGPFQGKKCFQFGNQGVMKSKCRYRVPAFVAEHKVMIEVDVIPSDIPMLLSKAEMKNRSMVLYMLEDKADIMGKTIHLGTTSAGHYLLPLTQNDQEVMISEVFPVDQVLATSLITASGEEKKAALLKLHRQFGHRPKKSFVDLLKSAEAYSDDMSAIIDSIIDGCEGCIKRKRNPDKPAVAMPMASEFNEKVAIDLKLWKGKYILYMIDMWSRLTVASFISRKKPGEVIDMIMQKWVANFGVMNAILNDNGGEFTGNEMREVKSVLNVADLTTGAESPWQNGLCEKNHALADNILDRIDEDYPDMDIHTKLAWTCSAKNSLQMVYGYSPYQLVFGKNPKLPNILSSGPPSWEEGTMSEALVKHLNALHATRAAFIKSESCSRLKKALMAKMRPNTEVFDNGDIVYYKRERDDRWLGPGKVVFQDGKVIFVRHGSQFVRVSTCRIQKAGCELAKKSVEDSLKDPDQSQSSFKDFEIDKIPQSVEMYPLGEDKIEADLNETAEEIVGDPIRSDAGMTPVEDVIESSEQGRVDKGKILLRRNDRIRFKEGQQWVDATITGRGKCTGKYKNWFNVRREDGKEDHSVDLQAVDYEMVESPEIEHAMVVNIPREEQNTPECLLAKETELKKLKDFKTYELVQDCGQEKISTTWVINNKGSEVRARLVARGFEETNDIPKDSPTLGKSSLRMLLVIAAGMCWQVETTDIKSAFLQGAAIDRDVFIKPPKEANVSRGSVWKLNKCLYGLKDASRKWYFKVRENLLNAKFVQSQLDPGVFYKYNNLGNLIGIVGIHVDDFIHAGSKFFNTHVLEPVMKVFQVGKNEKGNFKYTGFRILQNAEGILLNQDEYTKSSIEILPIAPERQSDKTAKLTEEERSNLRRMTGSLNWVVRATRPDLSFEMIELSTKFRSGTIDDLIRVRKALINLQSNKAEIRIPHLGNPKNWIIICYTDAALGNLNDGVDSTGGFVIFITNAERKECAVLDWQSNKIRRVVRSTLAAEALSLCEGLEASLHLRDMIEDVLNFDSKSIDIHALVDNQSTVDAVKSTTVVDDKRLRREIGAIKQMLERGEVKTVQWIPGSEQLADVLTKRGVNGLELLNVIQQGKFSQ